MIRCLCAGTGCKKQRVARTFRSAFCPKPKNVAKSKNDNRNIILHHLVWLGNVFIAIF
nr:MAG TPA: hypothetical protein [Caudoviricetes sp.]